jgi:hypothetical protein
MRNLRNVVLSSLLAFGLLGCGKEGKKEEKQAIVVPAVPVSEQIYSIIKNGSRESYTNEGGIKTDFVIRWDDIDYLLSAVENEKDGRKSLELSVGKKRSNRMFFIDYDLNDRPDRVEKWSIMKIVKNSNGYTLDYESENLKDVENYQGIYMFALTNAFSFVKEHGNLK